MEPQSWEETQRNHRGQAPRFTDGETKAQGEEGIYPKYTSVAELRLTALSPDYRFPVFSSTLAEIETWALNKPDLEAAQI